MLDTTQHNIQKHPKICLQCLLSWSTNRYTKPHNTTQHNTTTIGIDLIKLSKRKELCCVVLCLENENENEFQHRVLLLQVLSEVVKHRIDTTHTTQLENRNYLDVVQALCNVVSRGMCCIVWCCVVLCCVLCCVALM